MKWWLGISSRWLSVIGDGRWHHLSARHYWKHPNIKKLIICCFCHKHDWILTAGSYTTRLAASSCGSKQKSPDTAGNVPTCQQKYLQSESSPQPLLESDLYYQPETSCCWVMWLLLQCEAKWTRWRNEEAVCMFPLCFRCDRTLWHWQQQLSHCLLHLLIVWFCSWTLPLLSWLTGGGSWFPFEVHEKGNDSDRAEQQRKAQRVKVCRSSAPAVK